MSNDAVNSTGTIPFNPAERRLGVVVGYDGSENASVALNYAARAAHRRGCVLTVVNSFAAPAHIYSSLATLPNQSKDELLKEATQGMHGRAALQLEGYEGEVNYLAGEGDAAGVLVDCSAQAQLMVVGARGRGGFLGRILGSVSSALPAHSKAPTVVVPANYDTGGEGAARFAALESSEPVVVGTDSSEQSQVAVLLAAQAAQDRGVELQLRQSLPLTDGALLWYPEHHSLVQESADNRRQELQKELEAQAQQVKEQFPELTVSAEVEAGDPISLLQEKTKTAQLTVVGTRGRGGVRSALLGSVSRGLLFGAEGPVMVVPNLQLTNS